LQLQILKFDVFEKKIFDSYATITFDASDLFLHEQN